MTLEDLLKVAASGEPVEVHDVESHDTYHPYSEALPHEWMEYEIRHFYSVWNDSSKNTKTVIEVRFIGEAD